MCRVIRIRRAVSVSCSPRSTRIRRHSKEYPHALTYSDILEPYFYAVQTSVGRINEASTVEERNESPTVAVAVEVLSVLNPYCAMLK